MTTLHVVASLFLVLRLLLSEGYPQWTEKLKDGTRFKNRVRKLPEALDLGQCGQRQWSSSDSWWGTDDPILSRNVNYDHQTLYLQNIGRFALLHSDEVKVQAQTVACSGSVSSKGACFNGVAVQITYGGLNFTVDWRCQMAGNKLGCKLHNLCEDEKIITPCTSCKAGVCREVKEQVSSWSAEALSKSYRDWFSDRSFVLRDELDIFVRDGSKKVQFRLSAVVSSDERIDIQIGVEPNLRGYSGRLFGDNVSANGLCGKIEEWTSIWGRKWGLAPNCNTSSVSDWTDWSSNTGSAGDVCYGFFGDIAHDGECGCENGKKYLTKYSGETVLVSFSGYTSSTQSTRQFQKDPFLEEWMESFRVGWNSNLSDNPLSIFRDDLELALSLQNNPELGKSAMMIADAENAKRMRALVNEQHYNWQKNGVHLQCTFEVDDKMIAEIQQYCSAAVQACAQRQTEGDVEGNKKTDGYKEQDKKSENHKVDATEAVKICMAGLEYDVNSLSASCIAEAPNTIEVYLHEMFVQGDACLSQRAATMNHLAAKGVNLEDTDIGVQVSQEANILEDIHRDDGSAAKSTGASQLSPCFDQDGKAKKGLLWDDGAQEMFSEDRFPGDPALPNRHGNFYFRGNSRNVGFSDELLELNRTADSPANLVCWLAHEDVKWKRIRIRTPAPYTVNEDVTFVKVYTGKEPVREVMFKTCQDLHPLMRPICAYPNSHWQQDKTPPRCEPMSRPSNFWQYLQTDWPKDYAQFLDAAAYAGRGSVHSMVPDGNGHRWSNQKDTQIATMCVLPVFYWRFTVGKYNFAWRLVRANNNDVANKDLLATCAERNLVPLCGCDIEKKGYRDGKCLPLSMLTLKDRASDQRCVWERRSEDAWNTSSTGWFYDVVLYSGKHTMSYIAGQFANSHWRFRSTICADVRVKIETADFVGEMVRRPFTGPPRGVNLLKACKQISLFPVCDVGKVTTTNSHCQGFGNKVPWSEDKGDWPNGVRRTDLLESYFYTGDNGFGKGVGEDGPIEVSEKDVDKHQHYSTWCLVVMTEKPKQGRDDKIPAATPQCHEPRQKWRTVFGTTTPKFCDARGIDVVVVVNEAAYLKYSYKAVDGYDAKTVVPHTSHSATEFESASDGYANLHTKIVPNILREFANTCADGHVNRVAAIVNTGNGAQPVRYPCPGQDNNPDVIGSSCGPELNYLVAEEIVAFEQLNTACEKPDADSRDAKLGVMGLKLEDKERLKSGGPNEKEYEAVPVCDMGTKSEVKEGGPCWMCRQYDVDSGEIGIVKFDKFKYFYEETKMPICINPDRCPDNPILTKNASDWHCKDNDWFLTATVGFACQVSQMTGLQKALELLAEDQNLEPGPQTNTPARQRAIVWISDGNFRDPPLNKQDQAKLQKYEESVKAASTAEQVNEKADEFETNSQKLVENELLETIQDFVSSDKSLFISVKVQLDEMRLPNDDFFARLKSMQKGGKLNMHHLDFGKGAFAETNRIDNSGEAPPAVPPSNKNPPIARPNRTDNQGKAVKKLRKSTIGDGGEGLARQANAQEQIIMLLNGEKAAEVNAQMLLRDVCGIDMVLRNRGIKSHLDDANDDLDDDSNKTQNSSLAQRRGHANNKGAAAHVIGKSKKRASPLPQRQTVDEIKDDTKEIIEISHRRDQKVHTHRKHLMRQAVDLSPAVAESADEIETDNTAAVAQQSGQAGNQMAAFELTDKWKKKSMLRRVQHTVGKIQDEADQFLEILPGGDHKVSHHPHGGRLIRRKQDWAVDSDGHVWEDAV